MHPHSRCLSQRRWSHRCSINHHGRFHFTVKARARRDRPAILPSRLPWLMAAACNATVQAVVCLDGDNTFFFSSGHIESGHASATSKHTHPALGLTCHLFFFLDFNTLCVPEITLFANRVCAVVGIELRERVVSRHYHSQRLQVNTMNSMPRCYLGRSACRPRR